MLLGDFALYGTYANQTAEWTDDDPTQGIIAGNSVHDIPKDSFFGEIRWNSNERFSAALTSQYISDRLGANVFVPGFCNPFFCFDADGNGVDGGEFLGTQEIEGYWLWNLAASYELPDVGGLRNVRLQLNIDNLFDETFISAVTGATSSLPEFGVIGGLTAESALDRYFIGFPRTVTMSVQMSF